MECDYQENRARICSDSISALAILKEHISKEAVRLRQEVSEHLVLVEQSIPSFLKLIDPKLKYQRKLAERVELIDAIHEIATAEEDTRWLEEEYRYIHEHADELRKEHAKAPQALPLICDACSASRKHPPRHRQPRCNNVMNLIRLSHSPVLPPVPPINTPQKERARRERHTSTRLERRFTISRLARVARLRELRRGPLDALRQPR